MFTSEVMYKKYILKAGLHATIFVTIKSKLVEHKKSGLISYFGIPFRRELKRLQRGHFKIALRSVN